MRLDLQSPVGLRAVQGEWRFAQGLVPGEPNEGLGARMAGSPARLADYDDSGWDVVEDITKWLSDGLTFGWYRIRVTLPDSVSGSSIEGTRCLFETCIDDYGEVWVDGEIDVMRGVVAGFNVLQRVVVSPSVQPGDKHTIALLAINGPLARPGAPSSFATRRWPSSGPIRRTGSLRVLGRAGYLCTEGVAARRVEKARSDSVCSGLSDGSFQEGYLYRRVGQSPAVGYHVGCFLSAR